MHAHKKTLLKFLNVIIGVWLCQMSDVSALLCPPGRCSVFPDLNVITFDGNSVAIYKAASYIVTQLPDETVSILVQECPADSESPVSHCHTFPQNSPSKATSLEQKEDI